MRKLLFSAALAMIALLFSCGGKWVAKIDGDKISLEEFNRAYYVQMKMMYNTAPDEIDKLAKDPKALESNPLLDKAIYLDELIKRKIVVKEAASEKLLDDPEYKILTKMTNDSMIVAYYAKNLFEKKIVITDEEITTYLTSQKEYFLKTGWSMEQIRMNIRNHLQSQKALKMAGDLMTELKDKAKIEKNTEVIKVLSEKPAAERPKDGWVLKINGDELSVKDFEMMYYAQNKTIYNVPNDEIDKIAKNPSAIQSNPILNKEEFVEQILRQRLLYAKAESDDVLENKELKDIITTQEEINCYMFYLMRKFKDKITVSEDEVAFIYEKQKEQMKNAPIDQAEQYIRQVVYAQKFQYEVEKFITDLKTKSAIEKDVTAINPAASK